MRDGLWNKVKKVMKSPRELQQLHKVKTWIDKALTHIGSALQIISYTISSSIKVQRRYETSSRIYSVIK